MKNLIPFIVTTLALLCSEALQAQVSSYTFSQTLSTYGPPNSGTLIGTNFQDDDVNTVNLPFGFTYNGTTYTSVNVCSNGYLSFSNLSGTEYYALSDMSTNNVIAPFSQDLVMGTLLKGDLTTGSNTIANVSFTTGLSVGDELGNFMGDFPGTPTITAIVGNTIVVNQNALNTTASADVMIMSGGLRQSTSGVAPNRICEFEYRNMSRFSIYNEMINFKVKLYETSHAIEFVYGFMSADLTSIPSEVGLKGNNSSDFNSRWVTSIDTWSASVAASLISHACSFSSTKFPDNGLSYLWNPATCTTPSIVFPWIVPAVCAGASATLSVSGANSYSWNTGSTSASIVITPTTTTSYTVFGYNGSCSSSVSITQPVNPLPTLILNSNKNSLCNGESATLTVSGASSYSWNTGSTGGSIVVTPTSSSSYTVSGSSGGCQNTSAISITVNAVPSLSIAQTKTLICKGNSSTLTVTGANSYTWSNGPATPSIVVTPTLTSTYTVTGSNGNCTSKKTITQLVNSCTGIEDLNVSGNLNIYPNPFNETLNLEASGESDLNVVLSDALGKIIFSTKISANSRETIHTGDLPSGIYLLTISNQNSSQTKKVIKH